MAIETGGRAPDRPRGTIREYVDGFKKSDLGFTSPHQDAIDAAREKGNPIGLNLPFTAGVRSDGFGMESFDINPVPKPTDAIPQYELGHPVAGGRVEIVKPDSLKGATVFDKNPTPQSKTE